MIVLLVEPVDTVLLWHLSSSSGNSGRDFRWLGDHGEISNLQNWSLEWCRVRSSFGHRALCWSADLWAERESSPVIMLNCKAGVEQSGNVFRSLGSVSGWGSIASTDVSSSLKGKMAECVCVCHLGGMAYSTVLLISRGGNPKQIHSAGN